MSSSPASLLITKEGGLTLPSFFLLVGAPVFMSGHIVWGGLIMFLGLILALRAGIDQIDEEDKQDIRYNIMEAEDVVAHLEALEPAPKDEQDDYSRRLQCSSSLSALAKKWLKENRAEDLALLCQHGAYITLDLYPEDDDVVSGSISLLALIAKDPQVRQRHVAQEDAYDLELPIQALHQALERAQQTDIENYEEQLAEIQRKGCLFLGALTDGDKELDLSIRVVQEGGLQVILDAANWFRHHEGVINWALWAIFIICFDNLKNKVELVRLGGILTVCQSMKNSLDSLEVSRHGVAILFDLLRQVEEPDGEVNADPWEVRQLALAAGLHEVVYNAMVEFSDSMDIVMMGQEMLAGTGFKGEIPQYQQA
jgi:hypothetical protein